MAATPHQSAAVPTVGGREAVQQVIKDAVKIPDVDQADTTTIDFGLAEPGRDVFQDKKHAQSDARVIPLEPENAEEPSKGEVSTKATQSAETEESAVESVSESSGRSESSESSERPASSVAQESTEETKPSNVVEDEVVEGPPAEDDAEAERARNELFPEADEA
ncbi:hypothetical protein PHLGIDRAFT_17517 [Phlebiopsis gigantea 11061_1 CR5-6]|uniref:Uncharacterized protein n=1 Tax=Phlebiopsis gigantea (strain 11061_1 CR5-6) TaxID=745531 RepID=A0A0C3PXF7_PHLG1|nr:hypothetical protein PHLGIDRAFT_17517 [Phlebiopsis gigantea 11061_1 CR5-6]